MKQRNVNFYRLETYLQFQNIARKDDEFINKDNMYKKDIIGKLIIKNIEEGIII